MDVRADFYVCQTVFKAGLFGSFFWEQGFDKIRESSRTLELFEGFDMQIQFLEKGPLGFPNRLKIFTIR